MKISWLVSTWHKSSSKVISEQTVIWIKTKTSSRTIKPKTLDKAVIIVVKLSRQFCVFNTNSVSQYLVIILFSELNKLSCLLFFDYCSKNSRTKLLLNNYTYFLQPEGSIKRTPHTYPSSFFSKRGKAGISQNNNRWLLLWYYVAQQQQQQQQQQNNETKCFCNK